MALPENYEKRVIEAMHAKGVTMECELCRKNTWTLLDQAVALTITDLSNVTRIPSPHIPCTALICTHCGNVRLLAMGALGLQTKSDGGKANE